MSNFAPTPGEINIVNQLFAVADPQKLGIVTGDVAVKVFAGAKLPPATLGEIWSIADKDNNGFLTRKGLAIAVRLIGHAQKGETVKEALVDKPGPLPHIEGVSRPPTAASSPPPKSPPLSIPGASLPTLTAQDRAKFQRLFTINGPVNGLLGGDKARDIFVKSKLPVEKLSQIWNLADTQNRGSLDQTDFTIAMYLIQASMSGQLSAIPPVLPPSVYEQASGRPASRVASQSSTSGSISPSFSSTFNIPAAQRPTSPLAQPYGGLSQTPKPHLPGQAPAIGSPLSRPPVSSAAPFGTSPFQAPQAWDVTADEKLTFDGFFDTLDTQKRGYVEGDIAVQFLLQSKLSGDILAQVWDLADLNNDGKLTRDGFAVAMHLIQGKLAGKEIPTTLPTSLIPPSMRAARAAAPVQPTALDSIKDLLWDDDSPASTSPAPAPAPALAPPPAIPSFQQSFTSPQPSFQSPPPKAFSPQPASTPSFPSTLPNTNVFSPSVFASAPSRDLLGDEEDARTASKIHDNAAEIGNFQNQLNSTNGAIAKSAAERQTLEKTLADQASQLSSLQTQLSSSKAAYETESRLLDGLRERLAAQTAEIQKGRHDLITAESDLSAVRLERSEVGSSLLSDKDEHRELQRKMKEVGEEIEKLKAETEKAKKEAKQQKGLLAIARKQLSTREAERAKAAEELAKAQAEAEAAATEREAAEAELAAEPEPTPAPTTATVAAAEPVSPPELTRTDTPSFAATLPLPETPAAVSPNGSVKSKNPFERLTSGSGSRSASPFESAASPFAPFAADDIPTPTAPPIEAPEVSKELESDDPFGLNDLPSEEHTGEVAAFVETEPTQEEHTPVPPQVESPFSEDIPSHPPVEREESNLFDDYVNLTAADAAPPTAEETGAADLAISDPDIDAAVAKFPDIDTNISLSDIAAETQTAAVVSQPSVSTVAEPRHSNDLTGPLKELDIDESDSDDDTEEFHDTNGRLSGDSQPAPDHAQSPFSIPAVNGGASTSGAQTTSAFDDAFGQQSSSPAQSPPVPVPAATLAFPPPPKAQSPSPAQGLASINSSPAAAPAPAAFVPFSSPGEVPTTKPAASGVNAFDEAMGKIKPDSISAVPEFSFDSNFDDTFDFNSFGTSEAQAPKPAGFAAGVNGSSAGQSAGFDDVFGVQHDTPSVSSGPGANVAGAAGAGPTSLSFQDAFGTNVLPPHPVAPVSTFNQGSNNAFGHPNGAPKTVTFDDAFSVPAAVPVLAPSVPTPHPSNIVSPERTASPPASPAGSHISGFGVRSSSPPPRHGSPRPGPRPSTASIDGGSLGKSAKHSKLSIRLPFGRNKDKKKTKTFDPPPIPPPGHPSSGSHLAPVPEPPRFASPAPDEDVEPVKQLLDLGFDRELAIAALEANAYDFQKALNSLVGAA